MNLPDESTAKADTDTVKLWLDYLGKLKDREDRVYQLSGMTNWALWGLIGALLYKARLVVPSLIGDVGFQHNVVILFILGLNFLFHAEALHPRLIYSIRNDANVRLTPASLQSLFYSLLPLLAVLAILLSSVEFTLCRAGFPIPFVVRGFLFWFGLRHLFYFLLIAGFISLRRQFKRNSIDFPHFSVPRQLNGRAAVILGLIECCGAALSIAIYITRIMKDLPGAMLAAEFALGGLVLSWAVREVALVRTLKQWKGNTIGELETEILLEDLKPSQIRERFVERLAGANTLQEWLGASSSKIAQDLDGLNSFLNEAEEQVTRFRSELTSIEKLKNIEGFSIQMQQKQQQWFARLKESFVLTGEIVALRWSFQSESKWSLIASIKEQGNHVKRLDERLKRLAEQLSAERTRTLKELGYENDVVESNAVSI